MLTPSQHALLAASPAGRTCSERQRHGCRRRRPVPAAKLARTPSGAAALASRCCRVVWACPSTRLAPSRGRPSGRRWRPERPAHAAHAAARGAALRGRCRGRAGRPEPLYLCPRGVHRRVRACMMGCRAPSSRHCGGRAPSKVHGFRPSRCRPDGPGTPRGGRLDRGRPAGPQDGPAGPPPVAAVSECEHRHRWSGTCARLARTVLPSIHTLMPICRRARSTSRRHPVHTRHARTHSSGQSDFGGSGNLRDRRLTKAGICQRHRCSRRAQRTRRHLGGRPR